MRRDKSFQPDEVLVRRTGTAQPVAGVCAALRWSVTLVQTAGRPVVWVARPASAVTPVIWALHPPPFSAVADGLVRRESDSPYISSAQTQNPRYARFFFQFQRNHNWLSAHCVCFVSPDPADALCRLLVGP